MPRINVTDEELRALEKLRAKNERVLGYNEGLEQAAILIETGAIELQGFDSVGISNSLRHYKRPLPL